MQTFEIEQSPLSVVLMQGFWKSFQPFFKRPFRRTVAQSDVSRRIKRVPRHQQYALVSQQLLT